MSDYSNEQLKSYMRTERTEIKETLRALERQLTAAITTSDNLRTRIQELEDALAMPHPSQLLPGYRDEQLKAVMSGEHLKAKQELRDIERSVGEINTQASALRRRLQELDGSLDNL